MDWPLPNLGDSIDSATVLRILVQQGASVALNQGLLEVETDKVTLEVPANFSGTIQKIHIREGDKIAPGQTIFTVAGAIADTAATMPAPPRQPVSTPTQTVRATPSTPELMRACPAEGTAYSAEARESRASPAVRRLARELGLALDTIPGSGPGNQILLDDVKEYARELLAGAHADSPVRAAPGLPDFTKWGTVERQTMSQIRSTTAHRMAVAWSTIPHVTHFDEADITALEGLRKKWASKVIKTGAKLTVTAILLKVVADALKAFPKFNASIDMTAGELIFKKYYHVGVAADTEQGLVVPVIRDADQKSILQLALDLHRMAEKARARKLALDDVQGASFTITNLGGIGGTNFTPIINGPEVAILAVSRGRTTPVYVDDDWESRQMLPLGLSYDHRLIDGADAARFVRYVVEALEQPKRLALE